MKNYPSILFYTALFVSFAFFSSCQNSPTSAPQADHYFPNRVGDSWTYAVSDSSGQIVDTLQVTVRQETKLADGTPANLWQYTTSDTNYTRYVVQQADSVFFYSDSTAQHITEKIVTPYKLDTWWYSPIHRYTIYKKDTVVLKNAKIQAYNIEVGPPDSPYGSQVDPLFRELWVAPDLGVVRDKKYSTEKFNTIVYQLQLLAYHIE